MAEDRRTVAGFEVKFKISKWLEANREALIAERPMYSHLVARIKGETNLKIGAEALRDLLKLMDIVWEPKSLRGGLGHSKLRSDVDSVKESILEREKYLIAMRADHDKKLTELQCQIDTLKAQIKDMHDANVKLRGAFNYLARDLAVKIPGWEVPPHSKINSNVAM